MYLITLFHFSYLTHLIKSHLPVINSIVIITASSHQFLCGKIGFLPDGWRHIMWKVSNANLCEARNWSHHLSPIQLVLKVKKHMWFIFVAECAMEGSMIFCQKNTLEHSMKFNGDYLKRCILTHTGSVRYCNSPD